jgi:F420-dependent oxidoreductase-like protein
VQFALMLEPQQGMTYADQLDAAKRAEANGFDGFFRSDHFASFPGPAGRPSTDAWTVVAGLARDTQRIGLGVLVSPVTFRHPGVLAKVVTTVDEMSGGRVELGVGAGWNEVEHRQLGLDFPPIDRRADLLEDQLAILHGLWDEPDGWSYEGRSGLRLEDALFRPRPVDVAGRPRTAHGARPRIIVGGQGTPRSYRLAARFADEFNLSSASPERVVEVQRSLEEACAAIGRDPATLARSAMVGILIGATPDDLEARERTLLEAFGPDEFADGEAWLEERRTRWIHGTPDAARARLERFASTGLQRIMLQDFLPWDIEHIDLMGGELVGRA